MSLSERDQKVIWHPYTQAELNEPPIAIVRGEGVWLYDNFGTKYIDAISSWWVNIHGHAHPYIAEKVANQLGTLEHVIFAGFTHEPAIVLAERLIELLPDNHSRIFYSDNGSTATEVAIKMAIQFCGNQGIQKNKIIAFEHAYHGDTFGAMSISARGAFTQSFNSLLFDVIHIPLPEAGQQERTIEALKKILRENENEIAAFIFEPLILGAGGMLMYEASVLDALIELCQINDILTIADEVMTGFGRTGKYFATDYLKNKPDIICLSKGITGGTMPLGVTSCSEKIYNGFLSLNRNKTFFHGHSYTANPLACTAAIASLDLLTEQQCLDDIKRITHSHQSFLLKHQKTPFLKNLRCFGTILALDLMSTDPDSYFNPLRDKLYHYFLAKNILLRPLGNTIYLMPPYCISEKELNTIYKAIEGVETIL